jgi:hypothetical protein
MKQMTAPLMPPEGDATLVASGGQHIRPPGINAEGTRRGFFHIVLNCQMSRSDPKVFAWHAYPPSLVRDVGERGAQLVARSPRLGRLTVDHFFAAWPAM